MVLPGVVVVTGKDYPDAVTDANPNPAQVAPTAPTVSFEVAIRPCGTSTINRRAFSMWETSARRNHQTPKVAGSHADVRARNGRGCTRDRAGCAKRAV